MSIILISEEKLQIAVCWYKLSLSWILEKPLFMQNLVDVEV